MKPIRSITTSITAALGLAITTQAAEPFLNIRLNVPAAIARVKKIAKDEGQEMPADMALILSQAEKAGIESAELFFYPDDKLGTTPVMVIKGGNGPAYTNFIKANPKLFPGLTPITKSVYKLELSNEASKETNLPVADYRLYLLGDKILIAPKSMAETKAGLTPDKSELSTLATKLTTPNDLVAVTISIPETFGKSAVEKVTDGTLAEDPITAELVEMGGLIMEELTAPLTQLKTVAMKFGYKANDARSVTYVQWYRDAAEAQKTYKALTEGTEVDAPELVLAALDAIGDESSKTRFSAKDERLALFVDWAADKDQEVLEPLMAAAMGMFLSNADISISSGSSGPVTTEYRDAPKLQPTIDPATIKPLVESRLKTRLFPRHYWGKNEKPHMDFECDNLGLPNMELTEINCDVISVTGVDGSDIKREEEHSFRELRFQPGFPASIRMPVKQGTKAENLGKAELLFTISAPSSIEQFTFTAEDLKKTKKSNGVSITLRKLGDHNASISFRGSENVILLASDDTGKYLRHSSWSRSGSNSSTSFRGKIKTVHVVAAGKSETIKVKKVVDLNKGKRLQLPHEATDTPIVRYTTEPMENAEPISLEGLKSLKVEWSDSKHSPGSLAVKYPVSPRAANYKWRACFFATDKPYLSPAYAGSSGMGPAKITFAAQDSKTAGINGAFGTVAIKAPSTVVSLTANRPATTEPVPLKTPAGTEFTVSFDKNTATVTAPSYDQVLDI